MKLAGLLGAAVIGGFCLSAGSAQATPVSFSTVLTQLCLGSAGCGVNFQIIPTPDGGMISVAFLPESQTINANPGATTLLGTLRTSCTADCNSVSLDGFKLHVVLQQTDPFASISIDLVGEFSGNISQFSSTAAMNWAGSINSVTLVGGLDFVGYIAEVGPIALPAPGTTGQSVEIGLTIRVAGVETPVPAPASLMLLASALVGVACGSRRLARKV